MRIFLPKEGAFLVVVRSPLHRNRMLIGFHGADPLRILRALRFAARFSFELDLSLQEAASTPEVAPARPLHPL